jgi:hypothetical protein
LIISGIIFSENICRGCSGVGTVEAAADIRPCFVNAATPPDQKFTPTVDLQLMRPEERQLQAPGSQTLKPLVLVPADLNGGKRAAADAAAVPAAIITIPGCVEKDSMIFFLSEGREEHMYLSFLPQSLEMVNELQYTIGAKLCNYLF